MTDQPSLDQLAEQAAANCGGVPPQMMKPVIRAAMVKWGAAAADLQQQLQAQREQLEQAQAELHHIDLVMARRPALDKPTRADNILHAINTASLADSRLTKIERLEQQLSQVTKDRDDYHRACLTYEGLKRGLERRIDEIDDSRALAEKNLAAVTQERDERFTESQVRGLMLDAADEWECMPLTIGPYKKTMGELVDSLLAEHKAQQPCATPTKSSQPASDSATPSRAGDAPRTRP